MALQQPLAVELAPSATFLPTPPDVAPSFAGLGLPLELAKVIETIGGDPPAPHGRFDRAAGLAAVAAIAEATLARQRGDVGEGEVEPVVVDQLQFAHARRVEQHAALRQ